MPVPGANSSAYRMGVIRSAQGQPGARRIAVSESGEGLARQAMSLRLGRIFDHFLEAPLAGAVARNKEDSKVRRGRAASETCWSVC